MADLIERSGAIDELKDMYQAAEKWGQEANTDVIKARAESCMASLVEMKLRIEKLPSAQSEQKVGKWIIGGHHIRCSVCDVYMCSTDREGDKIPTTFCPNCGAKMEEKDETD